MEQQPPSLRDRLRSLKMFDGDFRGFDTDAAPRSPLGLLTEWIDSALDRGVLEPHAMTLATASASGIPSARTLLLKDVDDESVWFASLSDGPKGNDLAENPHAALVLYWREQARQVRIAGRVEEGPRDVSEADFLQRHPKARAGAIAGEQSTPIVDGAERVAAAERMIAAIPDFVPETWTAYRVIPSAVEFWQGARRREQIRLGYRLEGSGWTQQLLWP